MVIHVVQPWRFALPHRADARRAAPVPHPAERAARTGAADSRQTIGAPQPSETHLVKRGIRSAALRRGTARPSCPSGRTTRNSAAQTASIPGQMLVLSYPTPKLGVLRSTDMRIRISTCLAAQDPCPIWTYLSVFSLRL